MKLALLSKSGMLSTMSERLKLKKVLGSLSFIGRTHPHLQPIKPHPTPSNYMGELEFNEQH